jgi:phage gp36-like protein
MPYITQSDIEVLVPAPMLIDALDDSKSGALDETLLASLIAAADSQVDSYLCGLFTVPFTTVPAVAKEASLVFACESLYKRRLAPDEKNPFADRARIWRERLQMIGNGELPLSTAQGSYANIGASILITASIDDTLRA